jgi:signal transduction histidine kinase
VRTLRSRFILSQLLPFLLIVPLVGVALIYGLETQVILPNLGLELRQESALAGEIARENPAIWTDPTQAEMLAARLRLHSRARIMFINNSGQVLAATDREDAALLNQPLPAADRQSVQEVLDGETRVKLTYSQQPGTEVATAYAPITGSDGTIAGVVRLTQQLGDVSDRFQRLRETVLLLLIAGMVLGGVLGLILALNLERPLRETSQAIDRLAGGRQLAPLPEQGPREIKTLLHAFNTLAQRLRAAEETRHQLLANLVHELGRPMGALYSAVQALLAGADQDEPLRRELLQGVSSELQGMRRLLDDLIGLHNQESGHLDLRRQPIDLGTWLPAVLSPWREAAQRKGLQWETALPPANGLPAVAADPDRLAQAIGNLLSNAVKYTLSGGTITVAAGSDSEGDWVRVYDTGPGIATAEQERIFEPFHRSDAHLLYPEGMGLGLAITRDIVAAHGGRLTLESAPGQGSTFTIRLPLAPA